MTGDGRARERLREAFLAGYQPMEPGAAALVLREAAGGRAGRRRARRDRLGRGVAVALAATLAMVVVATLVTVRLADVSYRGPLAGSPVRGHTTPAAAPSGGPAPGAAIVYSESGENVIRLQRLDYRGRHLGGGWTLAYAPPGSGPPGPGVIRWLTSVSPDGGYVTTMTPDARSFLVVDPEGRTVSSLPSTAASFTSDTVAWAEDSRHVCQVSVATAGRLQLVVSDVTASPAIQRAVSVEGVQYPLNTSVGSCSPSGDRAVLVEDMTAGPPSLAGSFQRSALVVRISTGQVLRQVLLTAPSRAVTRSVSSPVVSLDGRYLADVDAQRQTSTIVDLTTARVVAVEHRAVRGFSADDSRVVESSLFQLQSGGPTGDSYVVSWRGGQVLFARSGFIGVVRTRPGSADVAIDLEVANPSGEAGGWLVLVIVPAGAAPITLPGLLSH
jgi:hypothetical protein